MPSPVPTDLTPPILLVAMPQVLDPFFHKSVVLLVHQDDDEGSLGFILNRATKVTIREILSGLEIPWGGGEDSLADFGGPVQPHLGSVLFSSTAEDPWGLSAASEFAPGLALTQHVGDLTRLAEQPPQKFRLFLGYAGWGVGQLVDEILRNDWLIAPVSEELVFATSAEDLWETTLRSVGVDPGALPSWTSGNQKDPAN